MKFHDPRPLGVLETKDEPQGEGPDVEKAINDLTASFETKMKALGDEVKAANDRADDLELKLNRPSGGPARPAEQTLEQKAFDGFIRHGREHLTPDEFKALRVADNAAGGFLAPSEFLGEILKGLVQYSPVRAAARVGQMNSSALLIPRRTGRLSANWVGEIETRKRTEPAYGQLEVVAHEAACFVDVSNQLLEDAAFNIEAELSADFAEEFGRLEGEAFVTGNGVKRPFGLLSEPSVPTTTITKADADGDDKLSAALVAFMYSLPAYYRGRSVWMMSGPTIARIRGLRDGSGRFLWVESLAEGTPATLLGRPVVEAPDLPDIAAGATPILFGDIATAYRIYDRVGLQVLRDPFTQATNGITRFHARRRVGASVVMPEAYRKLKIIPTP